MPADQNGAQFLGQLKTAVRGLLAWLSEEADEPEHPSAQAGMMPRGRLPSPGGGAGGDAGGDAGSPTTASPAGPQGTTGGGVKGGGTKDTSLNAPASLEAGSFREPHLTEAGNPRVPLQDCGDATNNGGWGSPPIKPRPSVDARSGGRTGWRSPSFDLAPSQSRFTAPGRRNNVATDPPVSEAQRRAMGAAKSGRSNLGIPQSVGKEFIEADPGGKLPATTDQRGAISTDPIHAQALRSAPVSSQVLNPPVATPRAADQPELREAHQGSTVDPAKAYHLNQFKQKEHLYNSMKGQQVPTVFADKHLKDLDNLQKQMLEHAQHGGFAHGQQSPGAEGDHGMTGTAGTANWQSPMFPSTDAGTPEGARKAAQTRAGGAGGAALRSQMGKGPSPLKPYKPSGAESRAKRREAGSPYRPPTGGWS